jgi:MYXO-CTERM domain-containing protein
MLEASDGAWGDQFGYSVSLSADGSRALIGAAGGDTTRGSDTGSAYVFVRSGSTWSQEAKLEASDGAWGDGFGYSVSLSVDGSRALIGAHYDATTRGTDAGSAYVFVRSGSTWSQEAKLEASDGEDYDQFGTSVSLSADGSRALVGADFHDTTRGRNAGSAYVFGLVKTNGEPCSMGSECASGYCVDGVCCDSPCGGGSPSDCQACSMRAGASGDGTCGPLVATVARTVTCRPAVSSCDLAETCVEGSTSCPEDVTMCDAGMMAGADAGMMAGADAGMSGGADAGMMAEADAGMDAGMMAGADAGMSGGADAGTGTDGGTTPRPDGGSGMAGSGGGCGCRIGRPASGNAVFAFAALALVVLARRRRSR